MRNIVIEDLKAQLPSARVVELVERKGLGHPDTISDNLAEEFSRVLSKEYLKEFGVILHHNVDKLELCGGNTSPAFGGGKFNIPILLFFSGRATESLEGKKFDLNNIAVNSAKNWIKNNLRFLDVENHLKYQVETKSGAGNLTDLYERKKGGPMPANDTSIGVGFAPLTDTENIALKLENYMNSKGFMDRFPGSGEDVKIMVMRHKDKLDITVAMAVVDKFVSSVSDYQKLMEDILRDITEYIKTLTNKEFKINLNAADDPSRGVDGLYMTISGTSTEHGDDGAVGRGNRIYGLITPDRPMILEAAAGKNPVNHIGKIYNILANKIANRITNEVNEVDDVVVRLLSQIGQPIDHPKIADVQVRSRQYYNPAVIKQIVDDELARITELQKEIVDGKYSIC